MEREPDIRDYLELARQQLRQEQQMELDYLFNQINHRVEPVVEPPKASLVARLFGRR